MNDLISVITPTFNRAYILPAAIQSVRTQTHQNWEMIIVDDGSSDNTRELIQKMNEPRIIYLYQENSGQAVARNRALDIANGEWITFLDSDNEFLPPFMEKTLRAFQDNPSILAIIPKGNRSKELYEVGKLVKKINAPSYPPDDVGNPVKALFMREFIFEPNAFIHHVSVRDEGIRFDNSFSRMEDWDYAMMMANKHPDAFLYLPEILYNYHQRFGGDGVVGNTTYWQWVEVFEQMYQKHKDDPLMQGQNWYPNRVDKWRKIAEDFDRGIGPAPHERAFQ
jgi:glycosyltransferase involved in cell wall biosynthesis